MFDPYHRWLGIPKDQRPPTHYQMLGVARDEQDRDVIESAAIRQTAYVRNFQSGAQAQDCARVLGELALARVTLLDPAKRAAYDAQLPPPQSRTPAPEPVPAAPSLIIAVEAPPRNASPTRKSSGAFARTAMHVGITVASLGVIAFLVSRMNRSEPATLPPLVTGLPIAPPVEPPKPRTPAVAAPSKAKQRPRPPSPSPPTRPAPPIVKVTPGMAKEEDGKPPVRYMDSGLPVAGSPKPIGRMTRSGLPAPDVPSTQDDPSEVAPKVVEKVAVPEEADLAKSEASIRSLYKAEYARKAPADALLLSRKLSAVAMRTQDDPAGRYILLREARDLAAKAGDARVALMAIDAMGRSFEVDAPKLKAEALTALASAAKSGKPSEATAEAALDLIGNAIAADRFDLAADLDAVAQAAAKKFKNLALDNRVSASSKDLRRRKAAFERASRALETLKTDSADPDANLEAGKYFGLWKADWERALPLLAKGGDSTWRSLAEADLERPSDPSERARRGDAWYAVKDEDESLRAAILKRAYEWYDQAVFGLGGLELARVEKRLRQIEAKVPDVKGTDAVGEIRRFPGLSAQVRGVAFSDDGHKVIAGDRDGNARVWDAETAQELRRVEIPGGQGNGGVAFLPEGRKVVIASGDDSLRVYDLVTGREHARMKGQTSGFDCLALSADGKRALTGSNDGKILLWNLQTGQSLVRMAGHRDWIECVAFSPDEHYAFSASGDRTTRQWDLKTGKEVRQFLGVRNAPPCLAVSPDGRHLLTGGEGEAARVFDVETGRMVRQLRPGAGSTFDLAISPDGRRALIGQEDNCMTLWDLETGREIRRFPMGLRGVHSVAFSPDGRRALAGTGDGTVCLFALPD